MWQGERNYKTHLPNYHQTRTARHSKDSTRPFFCCGTVKNKIRPRPGSLSSEPLSAEAESVSIINCVNERENGKERVDGIWGFYLLLKDTRRRQTNQWAGWGRKRKKQGGVT